MERFHRTIERRFETGDEVRLDLESRNGDVLVQGRDVAEVRVVAVVDVDAESPTDAERDFRAVEEGMRADANRVRVVAPSSERTTFLFFGRGLKVDYQVIVPRQTQVQLESRNGRVEIIEAGGDVTVESRNGSVRIEKIGGAARITCRNGRVDAVDCAAAVTLMTRNGNAHASKVAGSLSAESHNGEVSVQDAGGSVRMRSHNGSLRYTGRVAGNLDIEVEGNGSVRLGIPADSRFELDAEAVRGDIKSELPVRDTSASSEPRPTVRLRTINGSIKIEALEAVS
ncbi:MAG: DUF4097 domain-containing protein [Dehalococcoidia bacterium]